MSKMWTRWTESLTLQAQHQLQGSATVASAGKPEINSGYQTFRDRLSPVAQEALVDQGDDIEPEWPDERQPAYCLVACPDGAAPTMRTFFTPEELTDALKKMDGEDIYAFPFLGIPLPFTESPARLLFLPDNTAVAINAEGRVAISNADEEDEVVLQDNCFMGPPELILKTTREADLEVQDESEEPVDDDFNES